MQYTAESSLFLSSTMCTHSIKSNIIIILTVAWIVSLAVKLYHNL